MENYVTKEVHDEFTKRIDAENKRQNQRITMLEETVRQINELTVSVKEMAVNMANMLEEQKRQGERLKTLEKEPADAHKQIKAAIMNTIISVVVAAAVGALMAAL